jgi:hypothetical protein
LTITSAPSLSERAGQPLVVGQADDVLDTVLARDGDRRVGRAVIDHQPLDRFKPRQFAWEVAKRCR